MSRLVNHEPLTSTQFQQLFCKRPDELVLSLP
jgi:hypothetical protein